VAAPGLKQGVFYAGAATEGRPYSYY